MFSITSFYYFYCFSPTTLSEFQQQLVNFAETHNLKGLVVLAKEGVNATVASTETSTIEAFKNFILQHSQKKDIIFKDSRSEKKPFKRFRVDLRPEIVTIEKTEPTINVERDKVSESYLSPADWHQALSQKERDFVLIDTRNTYETKLGIFSGAVVPPIKTFADFPEYVENCGIPKEKKVLMYCTGGIRCEKAALAMNKQGYENVYQLHGGILKYIEEFPNQEYQGECFVFDQRVSVDQQLNESQRYSLCPHCGDPAEILIDCAYCKNQIKICELCFTSDRSDSCSKNCHYHIRLRKSA